MPDASAPRRWRWLERKAVVDAALRVELGETLQALAAELGLTPQALGRRVRRWHEAQDEDARLARSWQRVERVLAALPPPPAPVPSPPRAPPLPVLPWQSEPPTHPPSQTIHWSPAALAGTLGWAIVAPSVSIKAERIANIRKHSSTDAKMTQRRSAARRVKFTDEQCKYMDEVEGRWRGDDSEHEADVSDQSDDDADYKRKRQCRCRCRCHYGARRSVNRYPRGRQRHCAVAECSNPIEFS